jgi:hypothetical protein
MPVTTTRHCPLRPFFGFAIGVSALAACGSTPTEATRGTPTSSDASADGRPPMEQKEAGVDASTPREGGGGLAWKFVPTTSTAELTQDDTSACGGAEAPCSGAWTQTHTVTYGSGTYADTTRTVTGFWNNSVSAVAQAPSSRFGRVSKVPMSALLPGYHVPVWVETQNWWGGGGGHIDNGESSANATQIANQLADHMSRGITGQVVDWYGPGTTADLALPFVLTGAEAAATYGFAVMIDKGYFQDHCGNTVACLNSAVAYIVAHYGSSPAYLKDASGHPLIFFFVNEYYPTQYALLSDSGIDYDNARFVMYEPNGFPGKDAPNTSGEYAWVNPADSSSSTKTTGSMGSFAWTTDFGLAGLTSFLNTAADNPGSYLVSTTYKGFDDNLANWSMNRVIDQQCGMTWLQSFQHTGSFGGSADYLGNVNYLELGHRLDMILVDTWDDYEEGTEIETGIDNCLASLDVTLSGTILNWTPTWGEDPMNAAVVGSEASLAEYSVFLAKAGGTELMPIADLPCKDGSCPHSLDVSTYGIDGGPYVFYVQAIGQPSIVNALAGPTHSSYSSSGKAAGRGGRVVPGGVDDRM